ncbi:MAG: hypothetical protein D9V47_10275 [Clostridia bacterium]|nr:MAG: hypothetical protein D9V47_10275 [Clostridia bacterium]
MLGEKLEGWSGLAGLREILSPFSVGSWYWALSGREHLRVIYTKDEITSRVHELGRQITADYQGQSLCVVGILKGAIIFLADLVRSISLPLTLDFMAVSSYGHATTSSGVVRILKDLDTHIAGRHVLIVEDIIDSGLTLRYLLNLLAANSAMHQAVQGCQVLFPVPQADEMVSPRQENGSLAWLDEEVERAGARRPNPIEGGDTSA